MILAYQISDIAKRAKLINGELSSDEGGFSRMHTGPCVTEPSYKFDLQWVVYGQDIVRKMTRAKCPSLSLTRISRPRSAHIMFGKISFDVHQLLAQRKDTSHTVDMYQK